MRVSQLIAFTLTSLALSGLAAGDPSACPAAVTSAIGHAFARSSITSCKAEHENGRDQFEVKLTKADGSKAEVDLLPDGAIIQVEEPIAVDKLPAPVTKAFAAKHPKAKIDRAEKQTPTKGPVTYELAFADGSTRKEVTFAGDGTFIEEE
jgi:hypothetical protein